MPSIITIAAKDGSGVSVEVEVNVYALASSVTINQVVYDENNEATDEWKVSGGKAYYLGADGAMVINKSLKINEKGELTTAGSYYHLLADVTSSNYRKTLDKLIQKGVLKGEGGTGENLILNFSEDTVRTLVLLDRTGAFG